ncbi:unnamed protein product [Kuraishia capsulata CBS 1993]|uniref:Autophagy-related protein 13 n=1 Tax=Kuraishia capsulata CBS 1993 TaxID=1382522 RepID=W6MMS4_9ASCO|nr:uncharacterized protein KUCA_T00002253001 [Kuraishia capsulata CBS 1993]CDK26282.1 unnamed protein product [Kuraishia capsulata CBS 1993]
MSSYQEALKRQTKSAASRQSEKLTQIVQNFFAKAAHMIVQSRSSGTNSTHSAKASKWFNISLEDSDIPKEDLKLWKGKDIFSFQPLIIEVYLDLRDLTSDQTLILKGHRNAVNVSKSGKKSEIVLERWLLEFDLTSFDSENVELPLIYKRVIVQFRVLFTFLKLLPAFKLHENLMKDRMSGNSPLKVSSRVLDGSRSITSKGRIGLSKKILKSETDDHLKGKKFDPILTPVGALRCSLSYRKNCNFLLNDNETLLSSHFISMESQTQHIPQQPATSPVDNPKRANSLRITSVLNQSSSPSRDFSPARRTARTMSNTSVQPFKVGSMAASPPPSSRQTSERKNSTGTKPIPVTGGSKSNSSASLAALLRSQRNSFGTNDSASMLTGVSLPKSVVSSSLGSYPNSLPAGIPEHVLVSSGSSGTPKFLSSFGSKLHRGSTTSRNNSLEGNTGPNLISNPMLKKTKRSGSDSSAFSTVFSDMEPGSGLYVDDEIGDFVKMLDSKPDLRFASLSPQNSNSSADPLNRFQSLRDHHNMFGDNLSASLIQYNNPFRKGSYSSVVESRSDSSSSAYRQGASEFSASLPMGHSHHDISSTPLKEGTTADLISESVEPGEPYESHHSPFRSTSSHGALQFGSLKPGPGSASVAPLSTLAYAQMHKDDNGTDISSTPIPSHEAMVQKVKSAISSSRRNSRVGNLPPNVQDFRGLSSSVPTHVPHEPRRLYGIDKQIASTGTSSATPSGFKDHKLVVHSQFNEHAIADDDDEDDDGDELHSSSKKYGHHDDEDEELLFAMSDMVFANKYAHN